MKKLHMLFAAFLFLQPLCSNSDDESEDGHHQKHDLGHLNPNFSFRMGAAVYTDEWDSLKIGNSMGLPDLRCTTSPDNKIKVFSDRDFGASISVIDKRNTIVRTDDNGTEDTYPFRVLYLGGYEDSEKTYVQVVRVTDDEIHLQYKESIDSDECEYIILDAKDRTLSVKARKPFEF